MKKKLILCLMLITSVFVLMSMCVSAFDYQENDIVIDFLPGDLNGDNRVTSADARICLRAAAELESLTDRQKKIAGLDDTDEINSSIARHILRASAKLETLTITVNLELVQTLVVGPLKAPTGKEWDCIEDVENKLNINISTVAHPNYIVGNAPDKYVSITGIEKGSHNLTFEQTIGWNQELSESFILIVVIS